MVGRIAFPCLPQQRLSRKWGDAEELAEGDGSCQEEVKIHSSGRLTESAASVLSLTPDSASFAQVQPMPSTNAQHETRADDPCCGAKLRQPRGVEKHSISGSR
jgi:hypothetical protein